MNNFPIASQPASQLTVFLFVSSTSTARLVELRHWTRTTKQRTRKFDDTSPPSDLLTEGRASEGGIQAAWQAKIEMTSSRRFDHHHLKDYMAFRIEKKITPSFRIFRRARFALCGSRHRERLCDAISCHIMMRTEIQPRLQFTISS